MLLMSARSSLDGFRSETPERCQSVRSSYVRQFFRPELERVSPGAFSGARQSGHSKTDLDQPSTDMNMMNTKRIPWTILVVFLAAISCLTSSSAMSSSPCDRGRPPENQLLETRPRHGAHGKQIVRKVPREMKLAAFFDDSTVMYASGNSLFLASIREGGPELEFRGHTDIIHDYKVEPGRKRIVTASEDGTLRLWDSRTGECLAVSEQLDTLSQPG